MGGKVSNVIAPQTKMHHAQKIVVKSKRQTSQWKEIALLFEAEVLIENWRKRYNPIIPNSFLSINPLCRMTRAAFLPSFPTEVPRYGRKPNSAGGTINGADQRLM